jgi:uncharacterized protein YyaL (SSP411 family)
VSLHFRLRTASRIALGLYRARNLGRFLSAGETPRDLDESARHLLDWTRRAFAAGAEGRGASAGYDLVGGWDAPYPEITGYFVPTLLAWSARTGDRSLEALAVGAGEWLVETSLPTGAICRKRWTPTNTTPSVFNTGQVLDGWCALIEHTAEPRWTEAATRAADWLLAEQDSDGAWRRSAYNGIAHSYYTRVAWPLARLGVLLGESRYVAAGRRHLDWVLARQDRDGFVRDAGFTPDEVPTTHTIAYVLEGLVEAGALLGDHRYLRAAERAAAAMRRVYRSRGYLPGRLGAGWSSRARWRCLTGDAQTGLVWARLAAVLGRDEYAASARAIADDLRQVQRVRPRWADVSGAIQGSAPHWGDYDAYRFPTHAAKFMLDLILALRDEGPVPRV